MQWVRARRQGGSNGQVVRTSMRGSQRCRRPGVRTLTAGRPIPKPKKKKDEKGLITLDELMRLAGPAGGAGGRARGRKEHETGHEAAACDRPRLPNGRGSALKRRLHAAEWAYDRYFFFKREGNRFNTALTLTSAGWLLFTFTVPSPWESGRNPISVNSAALLFGYHAMPCWDGPLRPGEASAEGGPSFSRRRPDNLCLRRIRT